MGMLTDPAFISRLESLYLVARKVLGGQLQADRRTVRKGSGITFADYAEYAPGDDHRSIDWRVYGRLEQLLIKMFEVEQDMTLYVLLDASPSMAAKFDTARQLAAALGYIALNNMDRLIVHTMADDLRLLVEPSYGRAAVLPFLEALETAGTFGHDTRFDTCARNFALRHRRRGMVLVISDFFFPSGFEQGLQRLSYHGHDLFCLQIQSLEEQRCDLKGDVELECVETGATQQVTVTAREAAAYEQAVHDWNASLRTACARRGIGLVHTTSDVPFDHVVQSILRRGGLLT
ncbi:MAG: DUF58 domain-containing protein [Phycisphaeraceae bacterium]